jgi:hypothetical protein
MDEVYFWLRELVTGFLFVSYGQLTRPVLTYNAEDVC